MDPRISVTYRSLAGAFDGLSHRGLLGSGGTGLEGRAPQPGEEAAFRAELSEGLALLEAEERRQSWRPSAESPLERAPAPEVEGILVAVSHRTGSLLQSFLATRAAAAMEAEGREGRVRASPRHSGCAETLEVKFDERDLLGWVGSFFTWWRGIRKDRWLPPPVSPEQPGDGTRLRLAMMGDWGTGLYGAPAVASSIGTDPKPIDVVLHLGDIYYSGTQDEAQSRFLAMWPSRPGAVSRALNANHEMYTGGEGYFRRVLPAFQQSSSCWAAQTSHFLLVGLDSAYEDHDLTDDQPAWLERLMAAAGQRKVVLFSHHQPFSLLDNQGPRLVTRLGRFLADRRIFAWYWGHEHRCLLYEPHPVWGVHGRCIGHGGYPHFRDALSHLRVGDAGDPWRHLPGKNLVPAAQILDAPNPFIPGEAERYGANGYAVIEIDGPRFVEEVRTPDGQVLLRQQLA